LAAHAKVDADTETIKPPEQVIKPVPEEAFSNRGIAFEPKSDPHFHLESRIARFVHRATHTFDLEPVDVPYRLAGLGYCVAHRLLDAVLGHPNNLDYLVRLIRHQTLLCLMRIACARRAGL